jgi:hypothetical protein
VGEKKSEKSLAELAQTAERMIGCRLKVNFFSRNQIPQKFFAGQAEYILMEDSLFSSIQ